MSQIFKLILILIPFCSFGQNEGIRPWEIQNAPNKGYFMRSGWNKEYKHDSILTYLRDTLGFSTSGSSGTVTSITATSPLTGGTITTSGSIGIPAATTGANGYLTATDWNTFNTSNTVTFQDWDLNKVNTKGRFYMGNTNVPSGENFLYGVWSGHSSSANYGVQFGVTDANRFYTRYLDNGTFTTWKLVLGTTATQYNLPRLAVGATSLVNSTLWDDGSALENRAHFIVNPTSSSDSKITFKTNGSSKSIIGDENSIWGTNAGSMSAYVYGNNGFNIATNGVKRLTINGSGDSDFTGKLKYTTSSGSNASSLTGLATDGFFKTITVGTGLNLSTGGALTNSGVVTEVDGVIGNEVTGVTGNGLQLNGSGTGGSPYTIAASGKLSQLANLAYDNNKVLQSTGSALQWATLPSGTVTSVAAGEGLYALASNPITGAGTIHSLAAQFSRMTISGTNTQNGIAANTWTKVNFTGTNSNSGAGVSIANDEFTILQSGTYELSYSASFFPSANGQINLIIWNNGTALASSESIVTCITNQYMNAGNTILLSFTNTDVISLQFTYSAAVNMTFTAPHFIIKKVY